MRTALAHCSRRRLHGVSETPGREERAAELSPLVRRVARRIARVVAGSELDDVIGDGCVGLMRAIDSFDPARGPSLEQYAGRIVAGAMLNGIRRFDTGNIIYAH